MHRRLVLLEGSPAETKTSAEAAVAALPSDSVLWAGGEGLSTKQVRRLLGRSFAACVIDLHDRFDVDLLAQCHGFVVGGGALVVRIGGAPATPGLIASGFEADDVTDHLARRVLRRLRAADSGTTALEVPTYAPSGTEDQARVVDTLVDFAQGSGIAVLTANRGRGKSTALGLALRQIPGQVAVTAQNEDAVREVFAFAPPDDRIRFVPTLDLLRSDFDPDLILVDEAAQLPVAILRELTERFASTPIVFATTTHGYEGTGRGFALRFVERLRTEPRELRELSLNAPIRWDADDPVESAIFDALLLDAEPFSPTGLGELTHREVLRTELAVDEGLLREVFGLLVQAHYRTTPGDLHRLLDAPNLAVHASFTDGHVVAASLVALEGSVSAEVAEEVSRGERRLVGHALPETFAAHLGRPEGAMMSMIRSVRIAVHPAVRRHGVASSLVEHVHRSYDVDLFGTLFGATAELLEFRRTLGYELVRLSASRGRGTGVPSVAMIRPASDQARELVAALRADLARDLPVQLDLHSGDEVLRLNPSLVAGLTAGLEVPVPLTADQRDAIVRSYACGPRTFESAAVAVAEFVGSSSLDELEPMLQTLVVRRVVERRSWRVATADAGLATVPAAMRALRRAIRRLIET